MEKTARIYVADAEGLLGGAICAELETAGYVRIVRPEHGADLTDANAVDDFFARQRPEYVFLVGGKTGGIRGNQLHPAALMRDNLLVSCHVLESAHRHRVEKLLYLASSCIYPKFCEQPMTVGRLSTGKLEPTNEPYATAKLAGLILCQAYRRQFGRRFIGAIPANPFGPGDNFHPEDSHVIAALMRRMHEAQSASFQEVEIWGSGAPRREFIFSRDVGSACLYLMNCYDDEEPINIGVGCDWSIKEIAELIRDVVGYNGALIFDPSKPDGMPAKLLDSSRLAQMGWKPRTPIREGMAMTYRWFVENQTHAQGKENGRAFL